MGDCLSSSLWRGLLTACYRRLAAIPTIFRGSVNLGAVVEEYSLVFVPIVSGALR
jgi:hypothetical protein